MSRWQSIALPALSKPGWWQDAPVQRTDRLRLKAALSAIACVLLPPSTMSQELPSQGMDAGSLQQLFNNACRTCHTIKAGDNRLGPNLYNVIGRKAGSLPDFNYSSAMRDAGFVWDEEKIERFIADPEVVVPGNTMKPYGGLASSDDRKKITAFLLSAAAGRPGRGR